MPALPATALFVLGLSALASLAVATSIWRRDDSPFLKLGTTLAAFLPVVGLLFALWILSFPDRMHPDPSGPGTREPYTPNQLFPRHRSDNLFLALLLLSYGIAGLLTHRMKFSTRGRLLVFLEDGSAWLMALACLVGACVFLSWIVDHYDTRNNERYYRAFRWLASRVGWGWSPHPWRCTPVSESPLSREQA